MKEIPLDMFNTLMAKYVEENEYLPDLHKVKLLQCYPKYNIEIPSDIEQDFHEWWEAAGKWYVSEQTGFNTVSHPV